MRPLGHARLPALGALLVAGCTGQIDPGPGVAGPAAPDRVDPTRRPSVDPPGAPAAPAAPPVAPSVPLPPPQSPLAPAACASAPIAVGSAPFRRLTRWEYANTVRDLLGVDARGAATSFPEEERVHELDNNAAALTVSPLLAERYHRAAEALAETATASLPALTGCEAGAIGGDGCARAFIARFGRRAYRRPLSADESERLFALYRAGAATDARNGFRLVLTAVLQAAPFLYRVEVGTPVAGRADLLRLGPYEIATRLSFLLWGTGPDEALLGAAEQGQTATREALVSLANAMLADPRARAVVRNFHDQWLGLHALEDLEKDAKAYPGFTSAIPALLATQAQLTVDELAWGEAGSLDKLFTGAVTFANAALAKLEGLPAVTGDKLVRVALDPTKHAGILSSPPLMALLATRFESSPIARGKFIRERLLCQTLPAPPPDVPPLPTPSPTATTRERFAQHTASPQCAGCHRLIDPVGFGLEAFDGVGRHREQESGKPVDTSGELLGTDVDGPFRGAAALGRKLAASDGVKRCVTTTWFRYAFGRDETAADRCTVDALHARVAQPGARVTDLLLAVVASDAFVHRTDPAGGGR